MVNYQDSLLISKLAEHAKENDKKLLIYVHEIRQINSFRFTKDIVNDSSFIKAIEDDYMLFQMNTSDRRPLDPEHVFYDNERKYKVKIYAHIFDYCLTRLLNAKQVVGPLLIVFNHDGEVIRLIDEMDAKRAQNNILGLILSK